MSFKTKTRLFSQLVRSYIRRPAVNTRLLGNLVPAERGFTYSEQWGNTHNANAQSTHQEFEAEPNPLRDYYNAHHEGPGIWKWEHYFDIYHRHFKKFRGREVCVLEIGVYSGGSLGMWKDYFGPRCRVIGVDIQEACKAYEDERTKIFIGDQADRDFWKRLKHEVPVVDILIDDGGHEPEQQIVTLEEMLPHLSPGGVFLCEDVRDAFNKFAAYIYGIGDSLNAVDTFYPPDADKRHIFSKATGFQRDVASVHWYPYVAVIEKTDKPVDQLLSLTHGTQWQPFSPRTPTRVSGGGEGL